MSESKYWQAIHELVTQGRDWGKPKRQIADEIVVRVLADFEGGEPYAAETLQRWDREGAGRDYTRSHKSHHTTTYITRTGRRIKKTISYSRPIRAPRTGDVIGRQEQLWWGWNLAEVIEHRSEMAAQREALADIVEAHDRIIAVMTRHPECRTAREAWEADGRSIAEIDLGEESA
jgi:hypothetical protein